MRRTLILLGAALVLAGPFVLGYRLSAGSRATTPVAIPSVVDEVRSALAARYYRPVPDRVLQLDSVGQIISALRDPYTAYLTPPTTGSCARRRRRRTPGSASASCPRAGAMWW